MLSSMIDLVADCVRWICERLESRNLTSEEEVERLAIRYLLRKNPRFDGVLDFVSLVKNSVFEEPISLSCFFPDRVEVGEGTLHARHGANRDSIAVKEMLEARRVLDSQDVIRPILSRFFGVNAEEEGVLLKFEREKYIYTVFISLIKELFEDLPYHTLLNEAVKGVNEREVRHVILLLTERTPLPFVVFFRHYSEKVRRAGILVWVVDVERESIDPFIGYPPEKDLIGRFKNPKLATEIESLWRVKIGEETEEV